MATETFDASITWVAPPGTTSVTVEVWGSGGGGAGYAPGGGGGGGGGGGYSKTIGYPVTPGSSYTITIGAVGTGGSGVNQSGGNGGDSSFDSSSGVMAKGGTGGGSSTGAGSAGGASGSGVGTTKTSGGTGGSRSGSTGGGGGGSGGDTTGGGNGSGATAGTAGTTNGAAGGNGGVVNVNGSPGTAPGGGGGGGGTNNSGAAGAAGRVRLTYTSTAPLVEAIATTDGGTATAAPVVNLPAGIQAGETLLVLFQVAVAGAIGWPGGAGAWNELFDASPSAADDQWSLAWRKATGAEGSTITLSCTSGKFSAVAWRISGAADPTVTPPELSTVATGTTPTQPNPTTVTPTGGSKDYLFGAIVGMEGEATSPPTYPTGYSSGRAAADSGTAGAVTTNTRVAGAWKPATAASEDPGAFAYAGTLDDWSAYAVAVHPAPVVNAFQPRHAAVNFQDPAIF